MNFAEIFKIQLGRVVNDFKLIPSILRKIGFDSEMKIPIGQLSKLQVFGGLGQETMLLLMVKILR